MMPRLTFACMKKRTGFTVTILVSASFEPLNLLSKKNKHATLEVQKPSSQKEEEIGRHFNSRYSSRIPASNLATTLTEPLHAAKQDEKNVITSYK